MSGAFIDAPILGIAIVSVPCIAMLVANGLMLGTIILDARILVNSDDDPICQTQTPALLGIVSSGIAMTGVMTYSAVYPCLVLEKKTPWKRFIAFGVCLCALNLVSTLFKIVDDSKIACRTAPPSLHDTISTSRSLSIATLSLSFTALVFMIIAKLMGGIEGAADQARLVRAPIPPPPDLPYWRGAQYHHEEEEASDQEDS